MTKIISLYNSILRYSGMESDEKGYISVQIGEHRDPVTIDGKRLVLPTDNQLKMFVPDEKMIFHPLSENILRGESQVLLKLKQSINLRLNYVIGGVAQGLLNIVASPALHSKLSADQSDLIIAIKEADEKTLTTFTSLLLNGAKTKAEKLYTNIYLKRGGTVGDKRYSRVGVVSFPFYNELMNDSIDKIRVKDKETFRQLFEFMFPDIGVPEAYNYGTQTQVAPFLDALMMSSLKVASKLNDIVEMYKDFIDNPDVLRFDDEWIEMFRDLESLTPDIRRIPVQQGNDGSISVAEQREEQQASVQQQTQYQPQPAQPQAMPVPQPAPVYQPQAPVYQQQAPQAPAVKKTTNGLDWKSVAASTPAVAYSQNPLGTQLMRGAIQQQQQMYQQTQMQPPVMLPPGMVMYPNGQIGPAVQPQMPMQQPMVMPQPVMMPPQMLPPGMMVYPNGQIGPIPGMPMGHPGYSSNTGGFGNSR